MIDSVADALSRCTSFTQEMESEDVRTFTLQDRSRQVADTAVLAYGLTDGNWKSFAVQGNYLLGLSISDEQPFDAPALVDAAITKFRSAS